MSQTETVQNQSNKGLQHLNVGGPVSKSISKKLLKELEKQEKESRKPHSASFRGWREITGFEKDDQLTPVDEIMDLLTRATTLDQYLPEAIYGEWYHGAGILIVGGLLSFFVGKYKFSLGPVFFVTFLTALYYRSSIRKYRLNLKLEAQREFSVTAIEDDFESLDWLNVFLDKYWAYLEPSISQQICDQVNTMMAGMDVIPAFIKQIWIHTLTLGTKPPRIDKVRTLERTASDVTVMDWWVSMVPNALEDSTVKQLKNKANQEVIVKVKLFGLTFPICVSDVTMKAKVRVRIRMMSNFPHIQTINVSLMEQPYLDFIAAPVGGDSIFSWEIFNIPGLYLMLGEMIKKYASPIIFSPLSFQLNLEQMLAGNGVTGALGVLQLYVKSASGLLGADTFNNTIDPYFTFGFSNKVLAKTKVVPDTINPVYDQKIGVMLNTSSDPLAIILYDENESDGRKDKFMGAALYDLEEIMDKGEINNVTLPILRNNKPAGEITFDLKLMKSLQGSKLPDGSYSPPPDLNTGVVNLVLTGARSFSTNEEKPQSVFAEIYVNGDKKLTSGVAKKTLEASWNLNFEDIVLDRSLSKVRVVLRDNTKEKKIVGSTTLRLTDIIDASYVGNNWFSMNKGIGEVNLSCIWNSIRMPDVKGAIGYTEPVGVLRIYIEKAEELINLEKIGIVDPYIRILVNGVQRNRTLTMPSTTNPVYNEAIYVPVSSINQRITIEAMDVERSTPDRTLGSFQIRLNEFVDFNEDGEPIETKGEIKEGRLIHKRRGAKGIVTYSLSFYPALPVNSPEELREEKEAIQKKKSEIEMKKKAGKSVQGEIDELEMADSKPKMELSVDKLQDYDTGILVFAIMEGSFPVNGYLQVFFDKRGYPAFQSTLVGPNKGRVFNTSDFLIKELNKYSLVTIRFVEKKNSNLKSPALKEITIPTKDLLIHSYGKTAILKIPDQSTKIQIKTKFLPVLMGSLPASDSIGNSGDLDIKINNGTNLPAGDSNGKSDPFCKIYLNGKEFFKTKTKKKTLDPEWNEETSVAVDFRVQSVLRFKVSDWDFGVEQDDKLGEYKFALKDINPFSNKFDDYEIPLIADDGSPAGKINVQLRFRPAYHTVLSVEKSLSNTTSLATDGAGKMLNTGVDSAGKVLGTASKVSGKVLDTVTHPGALFKRKEKK